MSDYAFFTGVTGMHWAVLTSPSKGGSQVSLDDDETVAVSGNYDASVSYSYQDPVTGGPARLMTGPAPTTPPSPHQLHAVRRLAVTVTTPGQVDSTRSGPCSGSTGLNRVGSAHYGKANFWDGRINSTLPVPRRYAHSLVPEQPQRRPCLTA